MSNKPLIGYFSRIKEFYGEFIVATNTIKVYDDERKNGNVTTTIALLTDNLELHIIRYDKEAKELLNKTEVFTIRNDDPITIVQRVFKKEKSVIDYIVSTIERTKGKYPEIHDKNGFKKLRKTRKAILSNSGTYSPEGFLKYTNRQKNPDNAKKIEQGDIAISCIDIIKDNSIALDLQFALMSKFNSVSCVYRQSWPRSGVVYASFRIAMIEYLSIDVSNKIIMGIYAMLENLTYGYPFPGDGF